jgi:hypothetical protein
MPSFTKISKISTGSTGWATSISVDTQGEYYISGVTGSFGPENIFLNKYSDSDNQIWTNSALGSSQYEQTWANTVSLDGSVYVGGMTYMGNLDGNATYGKWDAFLTKYSSSGTKLWTRLYGTPEDEYAMSLKAGSIDSVYVVGFTGGNLDGQSISGSEPDAFVSKFGANGSLEWTRLVGTTKTQNGCYTCKDSNTNKHKKN